MENLYREGFSTHQIAEKLSLSSSTVYDRLRTLNVSLRDRETAMSLRYYQPNLNPSQELAYILGVRVGDGYVLSKTGCHYFSLRTIDKAFAERTKNALEGIGLYAPILEVHLKDKGIRQNQKPQFQVMARSKIFADWLLKNDLSQTESLVKTSSELSCAFLQGLFDSEGCITNSQGRAWSCRIYNTNKDLLLMASRMMAKLGFSTRLYSYPNRGSFGKNPKDILNLTLLGGLGEIARFVRLVNPLKGAKLDRYRDKLPPIVQKKKSLGVIKE